jgi:hypothetical protein
MVEEKDPKMFSSLVKEMSHLLAMGHLLEAVDRRVRGKADTL